MMNLNSRSRNPLSDSDLQRLAPVVFADAPAPTVSSHYHQIKTIDVINQLRNAGWYVAHAMQSKARDEARFGYQRHMLRFGHPEIDNVKLDGIAPELILINAHDGASAYKFLAGVFRAICGNGLIVASALFEAVHIRHVGFNPEDVIDGSFRVADAVPKLAESIDGFRSTKLLPAESTAFAESALIAKYGELSKAPISPTAALRWRRFEDKADDLWTTLNVVQENLVQGGARGRNAQTMRRVTTREVKGIAENVRLNQAIWHLADQLKAAKVAA